MRATDAKRHSNAATRGVFLLHRLACHRTIYGMAKNPSNSVSTLPAVLFLLLVVICLLPARDGQRGNNLPPAVGAECVLRWSDKKPMPLATSAENNQRLSQFADAGDDRGIYDMILSGRALPVANGTRCLVIERGMLCEVRLLDGSHKDRLVVVPFEWLK